MTRGRAGAPRLRLLACAAVPVIIALSPWLVGGDPTAVDPLGGLDVDGQPLAPSGEHVLGTDGLGRSVAVRAAAAAPFSLAVAIGAAVIAAVLGTAIGLAAAAARRWVAAAITAAIDTVEAVPLIVVGTLIAAIIRGAGSDPGWATLATCFGCVGAAGVARVVRAQARALAEREHVEAARALGASPVRVLRVHVAPFVWPTVSTLAAALAAQVVIAESVLSYLGIGPAPPAPTWGAMIASAQPYLRTAPHLTVIPCLAVLVVAVSFHAAAVQLGRRAEP